MAERSLGDMKFAGPSPEGWHSIDAKFRCDWEYLARVVRQIEPAGQVRTADPLGAGLLFHAARARWFNLHFKVDDGAWDSILQAVRDEASAQRLPISVEVEQQVLKLMTLYIDHWQWEPHPEPVAAEYAIGPSVLVEGHTRTARLDDVSRYTEGGKGLWIGEAKTTSGTFSQLVDEYDMHGQTMLQYALWRVAPQGEAMHGPLSGIMMDAVGKPGRYRKSMEFTRIPILITDFQVAGFLKRLKKELDEAKAIRDGGWDADVTRNHSSCLRQVSGGYVVKCKFWELCKHGRTAAGQYQLSNGKSLLEKQEGTVKAAWE